MKNTLNSTLYNICCIRNTKQLFVLFFGALMMTSNLSHAQIPIQFDDFESGFGNWNDGGNRCQRTNNNWSIAGDWSIELRANSGVASSTTSDPIDLSLFNSVTIEFSFIVRTFNGNEDFFVEYNDGSGFVPIANYTRNVDFDNSVTYDESITLDSPLFNLSNNARFRIRASASGTGDYLYVDNINIFAPCQKSYEDGLTSLACPSVDSGGVGLSGADVTLNCYEDSTDIEANYLDLGQTTSYAVEGIPYNPPFQFNCLENEVSVDRDDVFSEAVNLPFAFCFYGNTYTSFVIGSNGIVSFEADLEEDPTGWFIDNDIPSTVNARDNLGSYFFGPSIFGVHHDVDPSMGGEIGYQLITLNTGCRALVAAWSDVPLYSDNSKLYTGMIVFYEDTNVIEVYIKDKPVDTSWNGGRATIGLQANENLGIVAPDRNSLDTAWEATDEAWRFTPNGASITELKWYKNSVSDANKIPGTDNVRQITVSPTSTTTYIAEVTYDLCNGDPLVETDETVVTVVDIKTWDGSESKDWENSDNWTPAGVPVISDCIYIPSTGNNPIISNSSDTRGYTLEIENGAELIQQPYSTLTIEDQIIIAPNGDLEIKDHASLVQITDVITNQNTGSARVQRQVHEIDNTDYVYWSSPVDAFDVESISPGASSSTIYHWTPTTENGTVGKHGTWLNTTENMIPGKGYAVRGLVGTAIAETAEFQGVLNNGQISFPISRGTYTGGNYSGIGNTSTKDDDNWNLMGNPYPSSISIDDFVRANPDIDGTLYFWTYLNSASSESNVPFYGDYRYNYDASDYASANPFGSVPHGFNDYIASGQAFFALMLDTAPTTSNVTFSNTMRNSTYANDGFYRGPVPNSLERHRIWLDLVREGDKALSILVGFVDGATNDMDRLYDGISISDSDNRFYSVGSDETLTIQGKGLPFDGSETFTLGYTAATAGNLTLTINSLDGLFENANQDIYLEDTELNITHNLRANPYSFTTSEGDFNDRFILRFNAEALSTVDEDALSNLIIRSFNKVIDATSPSSPIKTFELFDVTGRIIHTNLRVNNSDYTYQTNNLSTGAYIVKISLDNGSIVSKKLII